MIGLFPEKMFALVDECISHEFPIRNGRIFLIHVPHKAATRRSEPKALVRRCRSMGLLKQKTQSV